jgi:hypothetical protein
VASLPTRHRPVSDAASASFDKLYSEVARDVGQKVEYLEDRIALRQAAASKAVDRPIMQVSYPRDGALRISELGFLAEPESQEAKRFLSTLFRMPDVRTVDIAADRACAEIVFDRPLAPAEMAHRMGSQVVVRDLDEHAKLPVLSPDPKGRVRLHRYGSIVSTWSIASEMPGRMRFRNTHLFRKSSSARTSNAS